MYGIERELLLFKKRYQPLNVTQKFIEEYATLDFADFQIEVVTPPFKNIENVYQDVAIKLNKELFTKNSIWPYSLPPKINFDVSFKGSTNDIDVDYRENLSKKYGNDMLLMSGIHFNYSSDKYFETKEDSDNYYFNLMKKLYVFGPIIMQFFSFTPQSDNEYFKKKLELYNFSNPISIRNSNDIGYINEHLFDINYNNLKSYKASIQKLIPNNITSKGEVYSKVRIKESGNEITHIELRFIDLNPFTYIGTTSTQLRLITDFIIFLDKIELTNFNNKLNLENFNSVATEGGDSSIKLNINGVIDTLHNHTISILNRIDTEVTCKVKEQYIAKKCDIHKLMELKLTTENLYDMSFHNDSFENEIQHGTELSTSILLEYCKKNDIKHSIISKENNLIEITINEKVNRVKQATITNFDTFANVDIMNNKELTKLYLHKHGINSPRGIVISDINEFNYDILKDSDYIIKPLDSNFGLGISKVSHDTPMDDIKSSLEKAFEFSNRIIVEQYIKGNEYRFLVINNEVISIVQRIPANVIGDGTNTISKLIEKKNNDPRRGIKYTKPLEKINVDEFVIEKLKIQNLNLNSVLKINQQIFLRDNSNISTGGDSIEVSEIILSKYKNIAIAAAKVLDVSITGVDMIIEDITLIDGSYSIIEMNFNPAIHMHAFPFNGYGKDCAKEIISLLKKN